MTSCNEYFEQIQRLELEKDALNRERKVLASVDEPSDPFEATVGLLVKFGNSNVEHKILLYCSSCNYLSNNNSFPVFS